MNHGRAEFESEVTFFVGIPNPASETGELVGVETCAVTVAGASIAEVTGVSGERETTGGLTMALAVAR